MIDPAQFRQHIVRPALGLIGLWSRAAEDLLVGTAIAESGLRHLVQQGGGPACGVYQMEPITHDDIWATYLMFRGELRIKVAALLASTPGRLEQLVTNLSYATAMARVKYLRASAPLPDPAAPDYTLALGHYWKDHYNTPDGKGEAAALRLASMNPVAFSQWLTPHMIA